MSADGKRFVMFPRGAATGEERAGIVTVVSSWFDDLSRAFAVRGTVPVRTAYARVSRRD
jgi:hypothetical protein